MNLKDTGL